MEKPSRAREVELSRAHEILSEIQDRLPSEDENEEPTGVLFSETLREETKSLLEKYASDLASLNEAAARGGCLQRYENYEAMLGNDNWSKIGTWQSLLGLRCWFRRETGDRSGMESDVATVMRLRDHASKQHAALPMLVGRGMLGMVVQLARYDLRAVDVSIEQKRFWAKYLAAPEMSWEEECLETMRQERNGYLDVMDGLASKNWISLRMGYMRNWDRKICWCGRYCWRAIDWRCAKIFRRCLPVLLCGKTSAGARF